MKSPVFSLATIINFPAPSLAIWGIVDPALMAADKLLAVKDTPLLELSAPQAVFVPFAAMKKFVPPAYTTLAESEAVDVVATVEPAVNAPAGEPDL